MYICPTCSASFATEQQVVKHFLTCWKEKNPNHKSNPAPRSQDIETRKESNDMTAFCAMFKKGNK